MTTQLGFGGSLLGSTSPADSRRLLAAAYDAGIRHFDVAPMYSFGRSESLLRQALGTRIREVTITTKYGLSAPAGSRCIAPIHRAARSFLRRLPAFCNRVSAVNQTLSSRESRLPLTADEARRSIANSLNELRVSAIDLLLLHEATPERLTDPALLEALHAEESSGRIRNFGIGSTSVRAAACLAATPSFCKVLQFEWSAFSPEGACPREEKTIHHGSLGGDRRRFKKWLLEDAITTSQWSRATNADLKQEGIIDQLLLKAALVHHPGQMVLFSTRNLPRIFENVQTAEDGRLEQSARALRTLILRRYLPRRCDLHR